MLADARSKATLWCAVRPDFTFLLQPLPPHCPLNAASSSPSTLSRPTSRGALDGGLGVGVSQVLDLALLAALHPKRKPILGQPPLFPFVRSGSVVASSLLRRVPTYRPLGETQLLLAAALGDEAVLLLQAAAHDAGSDGEVAVVAAEMGDRSLR